MVIGVSLDQPLPKGVEFHWFVTLVGGEALSRERIVLVAFFVAFLEVYDFEIIWIGCVVRDKVDKDGLFFTFTVQKEFDVLI